MIKKGTLIVISGPSGVGKSTICEKLIKRLGDDIFLSVSVTERPIRVTEAEGVNYYFKTKDEFSEMIEKNQLLEWAQYGDYRYGTPFQPVIDKLNSGINVILEIEVQGAMQVKDNYPDAVFIFVVPPGIQNLNNRLENRNTESEEERIKRLKRAKQEFDYLFKYDYIVINDSLEMAVSKIESIIEAEKCRTTRQTFNFEL